MSCPVTCETLSMVPSTGAWAVLVTRPKRLLAEAITSPFSTLLPTGRRSVPGTWAGSTESLEAMFTVWTFPGSSVRATTVSASTASPRATSTVPLSGSRRSRRISAESVTRRPGV